MKKGLGLVEILIGTSLLILVFLGLYGAFQLGLKVVGQSKARVSALSLLEEKIEKIRIMSYEDIGTVGGIPSGVIPEEEIVDRNSLNFTVKTTVLYIDDPYDGKSPEDPVASDYKRVRIKVSWSGFFEGEVVGLTNAAPDGVETEAGGGTIRLSVFDSEGVGVSLAAVHIYNDKIAPTIDAYYETDENGNLVIAGAATSSAGYEIEASKEGFSRAQTYGTDDVANPSPEHLSVYEGEVAEIGFGIDEISAFFVLSLAVDIWKDDFADLSKISESEGVEVSSGEVRLTGGASSGWLISEEISPSNLYNWGNFYFSDQEDELLDIKYKFLYQVSSSWEVIPEEDLSGNSTGFDISPVDISELSALNYPSIKVKAEFQGDGIESPTLFEWKLFYNKSLVGEIDFSLVGAKTIGTNKDDEDVYKYSETHQTNSSGELLIENLEWDSYSLSLLEDSLDLSETLPSEDPINLLAGTTTELTLFLNAEHSALFKVFDASTTLPVFGAGVSLSKEGSEEEETLPTDKNGFAYFVPLEEASYNYEIYKEGYNSASGAIDVSGDEVEEIYLIQN